MPFQLRALALAALCLAVLAATCEGLAQLRQSKASEEKGVLAKALQPVHFVRAMAFKHQLRVCNAYPNAAALDVYRGKSEKLTEDSPMPYKTCREFRAPLRAGDQLQFRMGDLSAGTFSVSDLPNNDAVMLLVIHRHDEESTAVSFESHVFASLDTAQVAVIDTYKGSRKGTPKISSAEKSGSGEDLRFNSVVAINPGLYKVALVNETGGDEVTTKLVALKHESYVVIRTGVDARNGPAFPEGLVIFPNPDESALRSGSVSSTGLLSVTLSLVVLVLTQAQALV